MVVVSPAGGPERIGARFFAWVGIRGRSRSSILGHPRGFFSGGPGPAPLWEHRPQYLAEPPRPHVGALAVDAAATPDTRPVTPVSNVKAIRPAAQGAGADPFPTALFSDGRPSPIPRPGMGKLGAVMVSRFRRRFPRAFPPPVPKPGEADIDAPPDQFGNGQFFRAGFRFEPLGHFSGHRDGQLSLEQLQAKAGPFFLGPFCVISKPPSFIVFKPL